MAQISGTAGTLNIDVIQGDTMSILLDFTSNGTVLNLTGYTFSSYVMLNGAQVVAITTANTSLINGQVTISLTNTQTAALTAKTYDWYFRWVDLASTVKTVITGSFVVVPL